MFLNLTKSEKEATIELSTIYDSWSKKIKEKNLKKIIQDLQLLITQSYEDSSKYTNILIKSTIPNDILLINFRKLGVFRISKYHFKSKVVKKLLKSFLEIENLHESDKKYLKNINKLYILNSDIINEYNIIINNIKDSKFLFKKILAEADQEFYKKTFGLLDNPEMYFLQSEEISIEDLLECISYFIFCLKKSQNPEFISETLINESYSATSALIVIESIKKILIYKDFEIKIDFFDFNVSLKNNQLTIKNTNIDRAISWGYAKSKIAMNNNAIKNLKEGKTLIDFLSDLKDKDIKKFYEVKGYSFFERITLKIICIPEFLELFNTRSLYSNESQMLEVLLFDNYYPDSVLDFEVVEGLSIFDIILIHRVFIFTSFIYRKAAEIEYKELESRNKILLRSILPVFNIKTFTSFITNIYPDLSSEKVSKFLRIFSSDFEKINDSFDLQYTPFISLKNSIIISPTIFCMSNFIRYSLWSTDKSLSIPKQGHDCMINTLEKVFKSKDFIVEKDFKFGKNEIDLIVIDKNTNNIFIFECKNPYHPVNSYELRNTYRHLLKAQSQIKKFKKNLSDLSTFKNLCSKLKINFNRYNLHYGVINSNRLFSGHKMDEAYIICAYDLINFLTDGKIIFKMKKFHVWSNNTFEVQDLIDLVNGKLISDYKEFSDIQIQEISFRKYCINKELHYFNIDAFEPEKFYKEVN